MSDARFPAFVAAWATGKRLCINTPVKTSLGWKSMGDIEAGDVVFNIDGEPVEVTIAHEIVNVPVAYRLIFDSGEDVIADPDHLWYTIARNECMSASAVNETRVRNCGSVKTTQDIIKSIRTPNDYESNHRIPITLPFQSLDKKLPIKPYTMGAWLGDGTSTEMAITNEDYEVLESIVLDGYSVIPYKCKDNNVYGISNRINSKGKDRHLTLTALLKTMGVKQNKHIPYKYQNASIEQRMELLRGLMDTDGYVDGRGGVCEYTSVNKTLAEDVCELINGLGIKARIYLGRAMLNGKDYGEKYRVAFKTKKRIFNIGRKQCRIDGSTKNQMSRRFNRWIVDYEEVNDVKMRCLTVDSDDGLFLVTKSFIATHNTMTAIMKAVMLSMKYPGNKGLILRKNFSDLKDSTMSDFTKYTGMKVPVQSKTVRFPNGSEILFHHADELAGVAQNINLGWFFIEQAEEFDSEELFMLLRGRLRRENTSRQGFIIANTNGHNWIWRMWKMEAQKGYDLHEAKTVDNKDLLPDDFLEDLATMKDQSPKHYNRFIMNSWEDTDTADKVFDYTSLLNAVDLDVRDYATDARVISCDPAEFGNDKTVIYGWKGLRIVEDDVLSKKSLMETAGHCASMYNKIGASAIYIDDIGVGAGVRDRLRELKFNVIPLKSGARPQDAAHYVRLRDEMYMYASKMFKEERVSIPDDQMLIEDLAVYTYDLNSKGQHMVERKKDIKKRLGRSTDFGDACVMGIWGQKDAKNPLRLSTKSNEQLDYDPLSMELLGV